MNSKSDCQRTLRRAHIQFSQHLEQELKSSDNKQWWKLTKSVTEATILLQLPLSNTMAKYTTRPVTRQSYWSRFSFLMLSLMMAGKPPNLHSKTSAVLSTVKFRPKKVVKKLRNLDIIIQSQRPRCNLFNCAQVLCTWACSKCFSRFSLTPWLPHLTVNQPMLISVPKKGSKQDPTNYRPLSHLSRHQLLCDSQYGFLEKRSITVDMLSYITQ